MCMSKEAVLLQLSLYAIEAAELVRRGKIIEAREYEVMAQELRENNKELLGDKDDV